MKYVYGLNKSGLSIVNYFTKYNIPFVVWDDNQNTIKRVLLKYKNLKFKKPNEVNLSKLQEAYVTPGLDLKSKKLQIFKNNKIKMFRDLELYSNLISNQKIISITGTNGKSTTCKLIEKILITAGYNAISLGNIGNPILNLKINKKKILIILEVSSYQLQYSKIFKSKHAAILNIFPDHLERHKSMLNYTKIKSKIFYGQDINDYSYLNSNNNYSKNIKKIFKFKKLKS